jgi:hypothetical protein
VVLLWRLGLCWLQAPQRPLPLPIVPKPIERRWDCKDNCQCIKTVSDHRLLRANSMGAAWCRKIYRLLRCGTSRLAWLLGFPTNQKSTQRSSLRRQSSRTIAVRAVHTVSQIAAVGLRNVETIAPVVWSCQSSTRVSSKVTRRYLCSFALLCVGIGTSEPKLHDFGHTCWFYELRLIGS